MRSKPSEHSSTASPYNEEFPLADDIYYLNHAAVAPWPRRTAKAVSAFAQENMVHGAQHYLKWLKSERSLRKSLARLLNAPSPDDIALLKNTSEALSVVAYGIDWQPGDNIVSYTDEFPSNRIVWESLASKGVELRLAELTTSTEPEAKLIALCNERTRLITVSSVQYARGLRINIDKLGAFCRTNNILFCVDAIQSLGALPFDLHRCQADFVMADGHKWMLAPEGLALFYCRAEIRKQLNLNQFGWHMVDRPGDYDSTEWRPSPTATRFECGSPNMLGIHALQASLSLIEEVGLETISNNIANNVSLLIELIDGIDRSTLLSPREQRRQSGIVTFSIAGADHTQLYHYLMQNGVICAQRGGGIRFSPHFYTTAEHIYRAIEILNDYRE
ncbi:MAG: aminotransferase class V-fold PLP-dependent enzyme [Candidatus Polarisedimenticolaceae bacterium]|nr:aminotransferase class V-fold PLP-dependent enzyme [Candidatus Polarisedimenticolaceae bacterium]